MTQQVSEQKAPFASPAKKTRTLTPKLQSARAEARVRSWLGSKFPRNMSTARGRLIPNLLHLKGDSLGVCRSLSFGLINGSHHALIARSRNHLALQRCHLRLFGQVVLQNQSAKKEGPGNLTGKFAVQPCNSEARGT